MELQVKPVRYLSELFNQNTHWINDNDFIFMTGQKDCGKSYVVFEYYKKHIFNSSKFQIAYIRNQKLEIDGRVNDWYLWFKKNFPDKSKYLWTKTQGTIVNSLTNEVYLKSAYLSNYKAEASGFNFDDCGLVWYEEFNKENINYNDLKAFLLVGDSLVRKNRAKIIATGNNQSKNNILFNTAQAQLEWQSKDVTYDVKIVDKIKDIVLKQPFKFLSINFGENCFKFVEEDISPMLAFASLSEDIYDTFFKGRYARDESLKVINSPLLKISKAELFTFFYDNNFYGIYKAIYLGKEILIFQSNKNLDYEPPGKVYTIDFFSFGQSEKFIYLKFDEFAQKLSPYFLKYKQNQLFLSHFYDLDIWKKLIATNIESNYLSNA